MITDELESHKCDWPIGTKPIDQAALWVPGIQLYDAQIDTLNAVAENHSRVIESWPNAAGKTSVLAPVFLLSVMAAFPGAFCIATSGSERQLKNQLYEGNILPIVKRFPKWTFTQSADNMKVTAPNGSTLLCFVAKTGERTEGYHGRWDSKGGKTYYRPCAVLLDEAKTIPEDVHLAVRRIDPDFLLTMSTPGEMAGFFHDGIAPDRLEEVLRKRRAEMQTA